MLNVHTEFRYAAHTGFLYSGQFHRRPVRILRKVLIYGSTLGVKWVPIVPDYLLFSKRTYTPIDPVLSLKLFSRVTDSLIPSFGSRWIEALGTPVYFKLLPDEYLLCACGLYVEILRTVPQDGRKSAQRA